MRLTDLHDGIFDALKLQVKDYTLVHLRRAVKGDQKRLADLGISPGSCVELRRLE